MVQSGGAAAWCLPQRATKPGEKQLGHCVDFALYVSMAVPQISRNRQDEMMQILDGSGMTVRQKLPLLLELLAVCTPETVVFENMSCGAPRHLVIDLFNLNLRGPAFKKQIEKLLETATKG